MAKGKYEYWLSVDGLILVEGWARDGLSNKQIAHNIGISEQTLNVWRNSYPSFSDALKKGKEVVDFMVENALFKSAIEGNTTAQIFWLKNRRPDKWRDKPVEIENNTAESDAFNKLLAVIGEHNAD